jgi:hypothetical protein
MKTHSPGPWTCIPGSNDDGIYHVWDAEENGLGCDDAEHAANARLIAAAPKLLSACLFFIKAIEQSGPPSLADAEKEIRLAIIEATGEQKMIPIKLSKSINIEVYPEDAPKLMTWNEATEWAKSVGDGWRLPTKEELLLIYENRYRIPSLKTSRSGSDFAHWYWSCTEPRDDASKVYDVDFTDGGGGWDHKDTISLSSRLVRDN